MAEGWIKLYRRIQDCILWNDRPFDKCRAWIDILLLANHEDKKILFNDVPMMIKRGQYLTSIRKLSERWGWSYDKVSRFLNTLESEEMLRRESNKSRTLLTVINYEIYQGDRTQTSEQTEQLPNTDKGTDRTAISDKQEYKEVKKERNNNKTFIKPSIEEVRAYCVERGNKVDAQKWYDYYTANGWKVGRNSMKDWKASIRNWESNSFDKPKKENAFNNFSQNTYDFDALEKRLTAN